MSLLWNRIYCEMTGISTVWVGIDSARSLLSKTSQDVLWDNITNLASCWLSGQAN